MKKPLNEFEKAKKEQKEASRIVLLLNNNSHSAISRWKKANTNLRMTFNKLK